MRTGRATNWNGKGKRPFLVTIPFIQDLKAKRKYILTCCRETKSGHQAAQRAKLTLGMELLEI